MNEAKGSKFVTRKWNIVIDNSKADYNIANEITYNTEALKSNLCDYNDAYILLRVDVTFTAASATQVAFNNCTPFTKCITKIDETIIEDAENIDLLMPMCNLREYSSSNSETTESLWFFQKIEQLILLQTLMILNILSIRLNY